MKTIEISLKEMIVSVLYHWVPILLSTIIFAALLGGYSYFSQPHGAEYKELMAKYDQELKAAQDEAQQLISDLDAKRVAASSLVQSITTTIDPTGKDIGYLRFRIIVNPVVVDIFTVAKEYISIFYQVSLKDVFKEVLPVEVDENTLRALVVLNEDKNGAYDPKDPGLFTIRTIGINGLDASVMANTLYDYFVDNQNNVALAAGDNTLSIVEQKKAFSADVNKKIDAVLAVQRDLIANFEKEIAGIRDGIVIMQRQRPNVMGKTLGNTATGASIGVVLGLLAVVTGYVYRLPVLVPEQPQTQLGIRYLGGIRRKKGVLFAWLGDKLAGNFLLPGNLTEAIELVSANISEAINENPKVLITGTVPLDIIREFAQRLTETNEARSYKYLVSDDVNKSADAIQKLSETDTVILVERLRVSTLRNIKHEQERINVSGKSIVGYVLY